jgi:hypothetical protein
MAVAYNNSQIVTDGLFLYYDAKNPRSYPGAGLTFSNIMSNQYHGVKQGASGPTFPMHNSDGFFAFNGGTFTNNWSRFSAVSVPGLSSISFEIWWRTTALNADQNPISAGGPDSNLYGWFSYSTRLFPTENRLWYSFCNGSGGNPAYAFLDFGSSHPGIANGNWHHTVGTWDFATQTGRGYYDSVLKGTVTGPTSTPLGISGHSLRLGVRSDIQGGHFFGDIALVRLYNRALTPEEVKQNYTAMLGRFGI